VKFPDPASLAASLSGTNGFMGLILAMSHLVEVACLNSLSAELHRDLIRAGQGARFTDLIYVGDLASAPGGVGMEAVVCRPHPDNSIAVDVDLARSRPAPG
jgi:hypothetical protein